MKIIELNVMRGPNYWSDRHHNLIVLQLDIGYFETQPTNEIEGFARNLEKLFPSLISHKGAPNYSGGFFMKVKEGTNVAYVTEHIAIELQVLAGFDCGFGRTIPTKKPGVYTIMFSYQDEESGVYAANAAVRITQAIINGLPVDPEEEVKKIRRIKNRNSAGPSTEAIIFEAQKRGIPVTRLNDRSLTMLGYGANQKRIQATIASSTSGLAIDIAGDKEETKEFLKSYEIPVPFGVTITHPDELPDALDEVGFPVVIKPLDGNHGRGITTNINSLEEAQRAFERALEHSPVIIVEKFITGYDYRVLVVNYKFVSAIKRVPAHVIGDGKLTIRELIHKENLNSRRGEGHSNILTEITIDEATINHLAKSNMTLDTVPAADELVYVKETANISTGGIPIDATATIHPDNIFIAERAAKAIGLDICGLDIMAPDLSSSLYENGGAIIEVNAAPGLRMHFEPAEGLPVNVAEPIVDMLFPPDAKYNIPIVAVTGTNGKTTTVRLVAHMARAAGYTTGYTTTEAVYVNGQAIRFGDSSGPSSASLILKDPSVNFAVLESARGGILRSGLFFKECDTAIVTNVAEDHLGMKGIDTVEDLARVKMVVPRSVRKTGYAVLNADDDLVYNMRNELDCNICYFSLNPDNERIKQHCGSTGIAAVLENGYITIINGKWKVKIEHINNLPATFEGTALFMVQNMLAAALAAYVNNIKTPMIREALQTFDTSFNSTPGRMNMYSLPTAKVLVDYAHNPAGLNAIGAVIKQSKASKKIGIIAGVGDRRDADIEQLGSIAAEMFDEVIIRDDKDLRGRKQEEINDLLIRGIKKGGNGVKVQVIPDQEKAIFYALSHAPKGALITVLTEHPFSANETIQSYLDNIHSIDLGEYTPQVY